MEKSKYRGTVLKLFGVRDGWAAGVLRQPKPTDTRGRDIRFAGEVVVQEGDELEIVGTWGPTKFGDQIKIESAQVLMDESPDALVRMLADRSEFKGIGPARARKLVEAAQSVASDGDFGAGLEEDPERVSALSGVRLDFVFLAADLWRARREEYESIADLVSLGWTTGQAAKLFAQFQRDAAAMTRRNPYEFIGKVERFGFLTVDRIALLNGIKKSDPHRIRAGIAHCFDRVGGDGHTWAWRSSFVHDAIRELRPDTLEDEILVERIFDEMVADGLVYADHENGQEFVAEAQVARMEVEVFTRLLDGMRTEVAELDTDGVQGVATLNPGQLAALNGFSRRRFGVVSGAAGMGKTYLMNVVACAAEASGASVALCAPTGRAARKLAAATQRRALTVHKLLDSQFEHGEFRFQRGPSNPIPERLVVVDECSMVDVWLMWHLLRALAPGARLLLVGDHNQIPSVSAGAILRDLLSVQHEHPEAIHVLDEVVRQAGTLARNTNALLGGVVAPGGDPSWGVQLATKGDEAAVAQMVGECVADATARREPLPVFGRLLDPLWDVQVLSPTKKGPIGTYALNHQMQVARQHALGNTSASEIKHVENRPNKVLAGDKVMWTENDRELELDNGTQALVRGIDKKTGEVLLLVDDGREVDVPSDKVQRIELAYAITFHKSQGGEWPYVVVVASSAHHYMHDRNLMYTGCSRASRAATIVGDWPGIRSFADRQKSASRQTLGAKFVRGWRPTTGDR